MHSDDEFDIVNQVSDIEISGNSSEESDDDIVIKMSTIHLWTVSNPDELIFPHAIIVFSQPMGAKHPLSKESEPVEYFSQLSATNED
jgi:hypothetical protein